MRLHAEPRRKQLRRGHEKRYERSVGFVLLETVVGLIIRTVFQYLAKFQRVTCAPQMLVSLLSIVLSELPPPLPIRLKRFLSEAYPRASFITVPASPMLHCVLMVVSEFLVMVAKPSVKAAYERSRRVQETQPARCRCRISVTGRHQSLLSTWKTSRAVLARPYA